MYTEYMKLQTKTNPERKAKGYLYMYMYVYAVFPSRAFDVKVHVHTHATTYNICRIVGNFHRMENFVFFVCDTKINIRKFHFYVWVTACAACVRI